MRILLIVAMLVLTSVPVMAEGELLSCKEVSDLASTMMECRQNGVPIAELLSYVDTKEMADIRSSVTAIAIEAYEEPNWSTEEFKKKSVVEFGNRWYMLCLKGRN